MLAELAALMTRTLKVGVVAVVAADYAHAVGVIVSAGHIAYAAHTVGERAVLTFISALAAEACVPPGMVALTPTRAVFTELDGYEVTEVGECVVFVNGDFTAG